MNKNCVFLFCVLFITQTKSDECYKDFLKCFSEFADAFFHNITGIEHVNVSENIPEGFKQVKDFEIKSIQELTDSIKEELSKQSKAQFSNAVVVTDNPKTQIYVKSYFGDFFEHSFVPEFESINIESYDNEEQTDKVIADDAKELVNIESRLSEPVESSSVTSNDVQISNTEDSSTISSKITITLINDDKIQVVSHKQLLTTQIPDIKKVKLEQKATKISLATTKNTQKVEENVLPQKDLPKTNNNETSNINNHRKPDARSTTRNHNAQKTLWKNQFEKDIRENIIQTDEIDYDVEDSTDYPQIDYIDLYKDTTNEENEYVPTDSPISATIDIKDDIVEHVEEYSLDIETELDNDTSINNYIGNTSNISDIFPWIATIFIKNDSANSQFQYTCDGALLDKNMVLTAARCLLVDNLTVTPDDVVVILGKKSLHNIGEDQKIVRISQVKIHNNFSIDDGRVSNDLGLLVMEAPVTFTESIQPASLGGEGPVEVSATTAWDLNGELTPVFFEDRNENCKGQIGEDGTICATYGNEVPLCPSRGGLYVTRRDSQWYLHGIHSGLPEPVCFTKEVHYTPLEDQLDRIVDSMVNFVL